MSRPPAEDQFDKKGLSTVTEREKNLVQQCNRCHLGLSSSTRNAVVIHMRSSRATWTVQKRNMQRRGHLSAPVRRELVATVAFFRPQPHGRPSDVSIKAFPCIRKDVEPHLDCQESTKLLYANDTPTWQCPTSAEMPSLTLMTQVSAVWRGQPAVLDKEEIL